MSVQSPAERISTPVDGVEVLGALSPSRAGDFLACPLLYRFRSVDRLPEPLSPDAVRGTVVHKVLEDLFDLPAPDRTPERAQAMLEPTWAALVEAEPELGTLFPAADGADAVKWLTSCRTVLERYFTLEDPTRLEPAERELYVEALLDSKLLLRGFIDRLDVAPDGRIRVVDYKGLALDTRLPTPSGWTTMRDVRTGDLLFGSDGRPTTVTAKSDVHHRPCYRVSFADGSAVIADNVHLWSVVTSYRQQQTRRTISTAELRELHTTLLASGKRKSLWVENAAPLDLPDIELPIDPWVMGAWLGDGDNRSGTLTVGRSDLEDMLVLAKEHWPRDLSVHEDKTAYRVTPVRSAAQCTYGHDNFVVRSSGGRRCAHERTHSDLPRSNTSLTGELRHLGLLYNKHIPEPYLRSGRQARIDLLRGLMDTDGWWAKKRHRAGFTTTDDRLADDIVALLRTLGIHPQHFRKPYQNASRPGRTWHIIEFTPVGFNPFSLPRKATLAATCVTPLQQTLARRRIVTAVEPVDSVPTQCIQVDSPDSLYLCGDGLVPTHNTGRAASERYEGKALFQLKFYALVIWKTRGVIPAMLQLVYLGSGELLRYVPDEGDLRATERKVEAIWRAIRQAEEAGEWRHSPGKLCDWCSFQDLCPAFGGTPPPLPAREDAQ